MRLWRHAGWLADEELQRDRELFRYSTESEPVTSSSRQKPAKKKRAKN